MKLKWFSDAVLYWTRLDNKDNKQTCKTVMLIVLFLFVLFVLFSFVLLQREEYKRPDEIAQLTGLKLYYTKPDQDREQLHCNALFKVK